MLSFTLSSWEVAALKCLEIKIEITWLKVRKNSVASFTGTTKNKYEKDLEARAKNKYINRRKKGLELNMMTNSTSHSRGKKPKEE